MKLHYHQKNKVILISSNLVKFVGAEHYLLITPIDTTVRNYLFQQGNLRSLTI
jgi:hypothetical protein